MDHERLDALRISLLGGFRLSIGGEEIPLERFRLRKARNLVKLLALVPARRLHREQMMELLWPEYDPQAAANNLNQALHAARRAFDPKGISPEKYLLYENENLSLNPETTIWVDVEAFEHLAAQARREQEGGVYLAALELYAGDLLPEDPYEEWAVSRRETLRQEYLSLLLELGRRYEAGGEYQAGVEVLQKLVQADPAQEEAHAGLMRLYALSGQRQQALRQYQVLKEALRRELEVEPSSESTRLYQEILSGEISAVGPVIAPTVSEKPCHNLPTQISGFIGREKEIARIKEVISGARLVTLTGAGGVGKTRLALRVAEEMVGMYADGAWLVELAPLSEARHVLRVVAGVFGLQEHKDTTIQQVLLDYLRRKQLLLVLDNCEHLIVACAELAETILRACPGIHILATSREALEIVGETTFYVPSLASPDPHEILPLEHLAEYEAVQLFTARAQEVLPDFTVAPANVSQICRICQRLDGIPLAIEMAAAMVKVLSPAQIADRLEDCFQLLTRGSRTALPRHQTLRASMDWSYALLSEGEQILLRRLSVFAGGWIFEAAEAVCCDPGASIFDSLTQLVDKSLVVAERIVGDVIRYQYLEPIRQYAHGKLAEAGELVTWNDRHLAFYLRMAEQAGPRLRSAEVVRALEELDAELDNVRAALGWAVCDDPEAQPEKGLQLASALEDYWHVRGHLSEGIEWLEHGLARLPREDTSMAPIKAKACFVAGHLTDLRSDFDKARPWLEESVALYRIMGRSLDLAVAQSLLGFIRVERNWYLPPSSPAEYEAASILIEESLAIARQSGEKSVLGWILFLAGGRAFLLEDYSSARQLIEESAALFQEVGDILYLEQCRLWLGDIGIWQADYPRAFFYTRKALEMAQSIKNKPDIMTCSNQLGVCEYFQKDYEQMEVYAYQALEISIEIGIVIGTIMSLRWLGMAKLQKGDFPEAIKRLIESMEWARDRGDEYGLLVGVLWLARTAAEMGQTSRAVRLLGAVNAHLKTFFKALNPWDQEEYERHVAQVRSILDQADIATAWEEGRALPLERAIQEALAMAVEDHFSK